MHELHLMGQVVKVVDQSLREANGAQPSIVRLKISALSHLLSHDLSSLRTAFELASRGTRAEGASLDIVTQPVGASCRSCGLMSEVDRVDASCSGCGSVDLDLASIPEVVVQEVVVLE
jgi:hydrogenase nickel incorporation protein HypA/HybF